MVASEPDYDSVRLRMPCHQSCMVVRALSLIGLHTLQFRPSHLNRDVLYAISGVPWRERARFAYPPPTANPNQSIPVFRPTRSFNVRSSAQFSDSSRRGRLQLSYFRDWQVILLYASRNYLQKKLQHKLDRFRRKHT